MADDNAKTEKPTPERRRRARENGQFARSRDAGGLAATFAVLLVIGAAGPSAFDEVREFARRCFGEPFDLVHGDLPSLGTRTLAILGTMMLPVAAAATLGGIAIGFAEAGFHPQLSLVFPKFERLDPLARLKQLVDPKRASVETLLAMGRILVVAWVTYGALEDGFPVLVRLAGVSVSSGIALVAATAGKVALRATMALCVIAGADYAVSRFRLEKQLMMSRQEIKDEMKQQEGDPRIKQKARARARERLKRGLAKMVKQADVIVANPTHIACALRYRAQDGAPVLVAKCYDEVALYIRKLARDSGIPVVENRPLARAIAARVRVGKQVPVDLYQAVAEVLAFVYRVKNRAVWG